MSANDQDYRFPVGETQGSIAGYLQVSVVPTVPNGSKSACEPIQSSRRSFGAWKCFGGKCSTLLDRPGTAAGRFLRLVPSVA